MNSSAGRQFRLRPVPRWRWALWLTCGIAALTAGWIFRSRMEQFVQAASEVRPLDGRDSGGTLVIAGGGELPNQIRERFVVLAGGKSARLVVLPALTIDDELSVRYRDSWKYFGAAEVEVLAAESRSAAETEQFSEVIDRATGVWLGGGQQSWLTERYRGTPVERRIRRLLDRGGVVGGTSAGAACLCDVMIAGGRDTPSLSRGLGLWDGVVVDQHFLRRNRWQRMQQTLQSHPELTGFGVDEETALIVERGTGRFSVMGKSYVVACTSARDSQAARIEFLRAGDAFDLKGLRDGTPLHPNLTDFEALLMGE